MAKNKVDFTFGESLAFTTNEADFRNDVEKLIKLGTDLTKYNMLHNSKSVEEEQVKNRIQFDLGGYEKSNKNLVNSILEMAFEKTGNGHMFEDDFRTNDSSKSRMSQALRNNPGIFGIIFDIQSQVIQNVNSVNYLEDVFNFVDIQTVGLGDSYTWQHKDRALVPISKIGRNVNTSLAYNRIIKPQTLTPQNHGGKVKVNIYQMMVHDYDFGAEMARVARSFRSQQYIDVVDALFSETYVNAPFALDILTKTGYTKLAQRVSGVAGGRPARAYGTKLAFGVMSDVTVSGLTNFVTSDEYLKNGWIGNLWSVPSYELGITVETNSSDYSFRVPNDQILITTDVPAVLMAMETGFYAELISNSNGDVVYQYSQAWDVAPSAGVIKGVVNL